MVHDVVHRGSANNIVNGRRSFDNLHIRNLICGEFCYVQGVNLNTWMHQSVFLAANHSIQGLTILENPEILYDIR